MARRSPQQRIRYDGSILISQVKDWDSGFFISQGRDHLYLAVMQRGAFGMPSWARLRLALINRSCLWAILIRACIGLMREGRHSFAPINLSDCLPLGGWIHGDIFTVSASSLLGAVCYGVAFRVTHSGLTMHLSPQSCCQGSVIVDILTVSERKTFPTIRSS
jgi:hypothetical protein